MRRFVKALSGILAIVLLFSALPQATAVPELESESDIGTVSEETPTESVYDLIISKSRLYLLPGTSYRLAVISVAEPTDPQPEFAVESTTMIEEAAELPPAEESTEVTAATETTAAEETATKLSTQPAEESTVLGESDFVDDDPVMMPTEPESSTEAATTEPGSSTEAATTEPESSTEAAPTEPQPEETAAESTTAPELSVIEPPTEAITPIPADDNGLYVWRSNDEAVATVSPDGVVTAVSLGMAVVTASTADGSCTAVCEVMVVDKMPDGSNANNSVMATDYATPHTAITTDWVNQYADPDDETAVRTISPGTMLKLIRKEGNFYVAHTLDSTANYYMWAPNIFDRHGGSGYIEICKKNTTDTRRHWDMYTSQSLTLAVKTGGTATWTSSNANIATVSSSGAITPKAAGTTYITANQNGKKDVIHLTVITKYDSTLDGVVKPSWCSEYRCSHSSCTIYNRKVADCSPENRVYIFGESAGYYYARVYGESNYIYMWKSNIDVPRTWLRKKQLSNILNMELDIKYYPQGFAVDSNYCYSFEVANKYDLDGKNKRIESEKSDDDIYHRLFRYSMSSGELVQMQPIGTIGHLWHANDAAIVNFSDGKYIFVAAFSTRSQNYIVKLKINDSSNTYQEVARYTLSDKRMNISAITVLESNDENFARFLIIAKDSYYHVDISQNQPDTTPLNERKQNAVPTHYDESGAKLVPQGIHYDASSDKLYRPLTSSSSSKESDMYVYKLNYSSSANLSSPTHIDNWNIDRISGDNSFEIEGVGFGVDTSQIWFNVFEGNLLYSEICVDYRKK